MFRRVSCASSSLIRPSPAFFPLAVAMRSFSFSSFSLIPTTRIPLNSSRNSQSSSLNSIPCRFYGGFTTRTSAEQFNTAIPTVFRTVQDALDIDELSEDVETNYSDGVLTIQSRLYGTWVINKHFATRQIWVSSPMSGPSKYNYHFNERVWLSERDQETRMTSLFEKEFSFAFKKHFKFHGKF